MLDLPPALVAPPVEPLPPVELLPPLVWAPPVELIPPVVVCAPPVLDVAPVTEEPPTELSPPVVALDPPTLGTPPVELSPPLGLLAPPELLNELVWPPVLATLAAAALWSLPPHPTSAVMNAPNAPSVRGLLANFDIEDLVTTVCSNFILRPYGQHPKLISPKIHLLLWGPVYGYSESTIFLVTSVELLQIGSPAKSCVNVIILVNVRSV